MPCVRRSCRATQPLTKQFVRGIELELGGARARMRVGKDPLEGHELLEQLSRRAVPVRIRLYRNRLDQTVGSLAPVLTAPCVLNRAELQPEAREGQTWPQDALCTWRQTRMSRDAPLRCSRTRPSRRALAASRPLLGGHESQGSLTTDRPRSSRCGATPHGQPSDNKVVPAPELATCSPGPGSSPLTLEPKPLSRWIDAGAPRRGFDSAT